MKNKPTSTVVAISMIELQGNVIPHTWYKHLVIENKRGVYPYLEAILILSDLVYWYRGSDERDINTGHSIGLKSKFHGDKLQRSYNQLSEFFGFSYKIAREAVKYLEKEGYITLELRNVPTFDGVAQNVMYIDLVPEKIIEITYNNKDDKEAKKRVVKSILKKTAYPNGIEVENRLPKWDRADYPNGIGLITQMGGTYTENNTENNTENKDSLSTAKDAVVAEGVVSSGSLKNFPSEVEQVDSALDAQETPNPHVAPAPLSPISIEALEAIAKEYGCNGKSLAFANEFFWQNESKEWQVNASGAKMKNIKKHFEKFLAGKMPKEEKQVHPAYTKCVELFLTRYKELHQRPHTVLGSGGKAYEGIDSKGGKALKEILPKLEAEMRDRRRRELEKQGTTVVLEEIELTKEEVEHAFGYIMQEYKHENPKMQWHISNMSLPILNAKFNEVINIIKENHGTATNNNRNTGRGNQQKTAWELAQEAVFAKYGRNFSEM